MTEANDATNKYYRGRWMGSRSGPGLVYFLGFIGAAVYYIKQAATFWAGAIGILKALVWPAFLVYHLQQLLHL